MPSHDPRIDAYIANAAEFARPILEHLRRLVHEGCPDVSETMKWSAPSFDFHGFLGGMSAFKAHCAFGFWKGSLVMTGPKEMEAMGQLGRITSLADLPPDEEIVAYVRKAAEINEKGIKTARPLKHPKPPVVVPDDLAAELAREENRRARETFDALSPSHRREYVDWITEAKAGDTRARRLTQTVEWLDEGKPRNWKYMEKKAATTSTAPPPPEPVEPASSAAIAEAPAAPAASFAPKRKPKSKTRPPSKGKAKSKSPARKPSRRRSTVAAAKKSTAPKAKSKAKATAKAKARAKTSLKGKTKKKAARKAAPRKRGKSRAAKSARSAKRRPERKRRR